MNDVETPRVPLPITKSCCFVHQDSSVLFTRLYGSIALVGLLEHCALQMQFPEPMQTEPTTILNARTPSQTSHATLLPFLFFFGTSVIVSAIVSSRVSPP